MRSRPLSTLFSALLVGCASTEPDVVDAFPEGTDCGSSGVEHFIVTDADLEAWRADTGAGRLGTCEEVCNYYLWVIEDLDAFSTSCERESNGTDAKSYTCSWSDGTVCGRGHQGLDATRGDGVEPVGAWLAKCAADEFASVLSFAMLARELTELGAPARLADRCLEAARDEIRHGAMMMQLAKARGGRITLPRFRTPTTRDAHAIALENATEGCVNETWLALQAHHQAKHAADPEIRAVMAVIADDETRHAELARDIAAWLDTQIDETERQAIQAALERAWETPPREVPDVVATRAGLPDSSLRRALRTELHPRPDARC